MFEKVGDASFIKGEHEVLKFWEQNGIFDKLRQQNAGKPKWNFLDGPITANNPMGVHHAWGRTYKDAYQRYYAMTGHELRYQNGFDCQGLWVEVEVEKELNLGSKTAIAEYGIDKFVDACKRRVLKFAARQTEQSIRLGYWTDWDDPDTLRLLASKIGTEEVVTITTPSGKTESGTASELVARLGNAEWGGSYFTFSTENNETIWTFLKKCFRRGKIYRGYDVMPWSGRGGSAYSQMEVADGRKLTVHKSIFVRFPLKDRDNEFLLIWTTTPWTLTSNVAAAVNPDLEYVKLRSKRDGSAYYFAKDNLEYPRLAKEFKEGFGRPEWSWPSGVPKLKSIAQIFKEQGGYEIEATLKGSEMIGWEYTGPFDELDEVRRSIPPSRRALDRAFHLRLTASLQNTNLRELLFVLDAACIEVANAIQGAFPGHSLKFNHTRESQRLLIKDFCPLEAVAWFDRIIVAEKLLTQCFHEAREPDLNEWQTLLAIIPPHGIEPTPSFNLTVTKNGLRFALTSICTVTRALLEEARSAVSCHRVIDGGRDPKGTPNVVAGEGTGIVHIAPGCGEIDHKMGEAHHYVGIAPLGEDGRFLDGFGEFTGRSSTDPATAELVFEKLKAKHLLVNVEQYPHIYPHCWRTGDELVFRLVDEWFINMDWRDEIKEVTEAIRWLPDSVNGKERELEWLTTMRDWMISKKRFWGLALPIWVEEYEVNGEKRIDFEVMGSLEELKSRAVEGWEVLEGHTPHRPWIDAVKIKNPKTGRLMSRIVDVGNPWLDAGIVPFSTTQFNTNREAWQSQYPLDFVTECFPGQFRNWFYSMLSLATMMMWDEGRTGGVSPLVDSESTDVPPTRGLTPPVRLTAEEKRPFKTLLGHRLVMNEDGQPMHKSDGTAIWFEEAAEQLGVDTMRWMYLAHNPAQDLRFGTRHKDKPVTIETPDGPTDHTAEGLPVCEVVSKPADEVRRQILIPLWNSYSFFVNYARLDEFDPLAPPVPVADRPEIDRWVLSNLQALIETSRREFENYNTPGMCAAAAAFIDDLSNWYIRRNRRRFWRSRDASDTDKLAAYQTLYEVLVTLSKLLAPCAPFVCERMYQNLIVSGLSRHADDAPSPATSRPHLPFLFSKEEALSDPQKAKFNSIWRRPEGFTSDEFVREWSQFEISGTAALRSLPLLVKAGFLKQITDPAGNDKFVLVEPAPTGTQSNSLPQSVHLCSYPTPDERLLDPELNERMALAQLVVKLGHKLREEADLRVRQPLAELRFACQDPKQRAAIERLADVIEEELNLKKLTSCDHLDDLVSYVYKPNQKALGPKYGKLLGAITAAVAAADPQTLAPLRRGESVELLVSGPSSVVSGEGASGSSTPNPQPLTPITLLPTDIVITTQQAAEWVSTDERGVQIALSTHLTPELIREGRARDIVRQLQQMRKDCGLEIEDRVSINWFSTSAAIREVLEDDQWKRFICDQTLATAINSEEDELIDFTLKSNQPLGYLHRVVTVDGMSLQFEIQKHSLATFMNPSCPNCGKKLPAHSRGNFQDANGREYQLIQCSHCSKNAKRYSDGETVVE